MWGRTRGDGFDNREPSTKPVQEYSDFAHRKLLLGHSVWGLLEPLVWFWQSAVWGVARPLGAGTRSLYTGPVRGGQCVRLRRQRSAVSVHRCIASLAGAGPLAGGFCGSACCAAPGCACRSSSRLTTLQFTQGCGAEAGMHQEADPGARSAQPLVTFSAPRECTRARQNRVHCPLRSARLRA